MGALKTVIAGDIKSLIKAKHDRVIIIRDEAPDQVAGVIVPDTAKKAFRSNSGTILTFGARCSAGIKEGMHVMFGRAAGTEVTINDVTLVIMHDQDLMLDLDTMQTFHNKVLVKLSEKVEKIKSIIIPDNAQEQPQTGTVVRVGPDCVETRISENVLMGKFAGLQVDFEGEEHLCLREEDLFASI